MISSRTDLRKGVSDAKFNAESDFDVKTSLAPSKSSKNDEKLNSEAEKKNDFFVFAVLMFLVPPSVVQG